MANPPGKPVAGGSPDPLKDSGAASAESNVDWEGASSGITNPDETDMLLGLLGTKSSPSADENHSEELSTDPGTPPQAPTSRVAAAAPPSAPPAVPTPPEEPPEEPPARPPRQTPADIIGGTRIAADRAQNRPAIAADLSALVARIGQTPPRSPRAFAAALITEMLDLFDSSDLYAHPLRRTQFLTIVRETLSPAAPGYDGIFTVFSQLEKLKLFDRRAEIGRIKTATGWEPAPGSFDFEPTRVQRVFSSELAQLISDAPTDSGALCGPEGAFDFSGFGPDERAFSSQALEKRGGKTVDQVAREILDGVNQGDTGIVYDVDGYKAAIEKIWSRLRDKDLHINTAEYWPEAERLALRDLLLGRIQGRNVTGQAFRNTIRSFLSGTDGAHFAQTLNKILYVDGCGGEEIDPYIFATDQSEASAAYADRIPAKFYTEIPDPTNPGVDMKRLIVTGENLAPWLFANLDLYEAERGRPAYERMLALFSARLHLLGHEIDATLEGMPASQRPARRQDCLQHFLANIDSTTPIGLRLRRFVIAVIGNGHHPEENPTLEQNERPNWRIFNSKTVNATSPKLIPEPPSPPSAPGLRLAVNTPTETEGWPTHIENCTNYIFDDLNTHEFENTPQAYKRMLVAFAHGLRNFAHAMSDSWTPSHRLALAQMVQARINGRTVHGQAMRFYVMATLVTTLEPPRAIAIVNADERYSEQDLDWGIFDGTENATTHPVPKVKLPSAISRDHSAIEKWLIADLRIYSEEPTTTSNQNMVALFRQRVQAIAALKMTREDANFLNERLSGHVDNRSELGQRLRNWMHEEICRAYTSTNDEYLQDPGNYYPQTFDAHLVHKKTINPAAPHTLPLRHVQIPQIPETEDQSEFLVNFLFEGLEAYTAEGSPESSMAFTELVISRIAIIRTEPLSQATSFWAKARGRINNENIIGQVLRRCLVGHPAGAKVTVDRDLVTALEFLRSLPRSECTLNVSNSELPYWLYADSVDETRGVRSLVCSKGSLIGWLFSGLDIYLYPASQAAENIPGAKVLLTKRIAALMDAVERQPATEEWNDSNKTELLKEISGITEGMEGDEDFGAFIVKKQKEYSQSRSPLPKITTTAPLAPTEEDAPYMHTEAETISTLLLDHQEGSSSVGDFLPDFFYKLETVCNEKWLATTPRKTAYLVCENILTRISRSSAFTDAIAAYFQGRFEVYRNHAAAATNQAEASNEKVADIIVTELTSEEIAIRVSRIFKSVERNYIAGNQWQLAGNILEIQNNLPRLYEELERDGYNAESRNELVAACITRVHGTSAVAENLRQIVTEYLAAGKPPAKAASRLNSLLTSSNLEIDKKIWEGGAEDTVASNGVDQARLRQPEDLIVKPLYKAIPVDTIDREKMDGFITELRNLTTTPFVQANSVFANYLLHRIMSFIQDTALGRELKTLVLSVNHPDIYEEKKATFLNLIETQKPKAQELFTCLKCESEQAPSPADKLFEKTLKDVTDTGIEFPGDHNAHVWLIEKFLDNFKSLTTSPDFAQLSTHEKARTADRIVERIKGQTPIAEELRLLAHEACLGLDVEDNLARITAIALAPPTDPDDWGILGEEELVKRGFAFPSPPEDPAMRNAYGWFEMVEEFRISAEAFGNALGAITTNWPEERRERLAAQVQSGIHGEGLYATELRALAGEVVSNTPRTSLDRIRKAEEDLGKAIKNKVAPSHLLSGQSKLDRIAKPYEEFSARNIDWNIFGTDEASPAPALAEDKRKLESLWPDQAKFVDAVLSGIDIENESALTAIAKLFANLEKALPETLVKPDRELTAKGEARKHLMELARLKAALLRRAAKTESIIEEVDNLRQSLNKIIEAYFDFDYTENDVIKKLYRVQKNNLIITLHAGTENFRANEVLRLPRDPVAFEARHDVPISDLQSVPVKRAKPYTEYDNLPAPASGQSLVSLARAPFHQDHYPMDAPPAEPNLASVATDPFDDEIAEPPEPTTEVDDVEFEVDESSDGSLDELPTIPPYSPPPAPSLPDDPTPVDATGFAPTPLTESSLDSELDDAFPEEAEPTPAPEPPEPPEPAPVSIEAAPEAASPIDALLKPLEDNLAALQQSIAAYANANPDELSVCEVLDLIDQLGTVLTKVLKEAQSAYENGPIDAARIDQVGSLYEGLRKLAGVTSAPIITEVEKFVVLAEETVEKIDESTEAQIYLAKKYLSEHPQLDPEVTRLIGLIIKLTEKYSIDPDSKLAPRISPFVYLERLQTLFNESELGDQEKEALRMAYCIVRTLQKIRPHSYNLYNICHPEFPDEQTQKLTRGAEGYALGIHHRFTSANHFAEGRGSITEDSTLTMPGKKLIAVSDGMGGGRDDAGEKTGARSSEIIIETVEANPGLSIEEIGHLAAEELKKQGLTGESHGGTLGIVREKPGDPSKIEALNAGDTKVYGYKYDEAKGGWIEAYSSPEQNYAYYWNKAMKDKMESSRNDLSCAINPMFDENLHKIKRGKHYTARDLDYFAPVTREFNNEPGMIWIVISDGAKIMPPEDMLAFVRTHGYALNPQKLTDAIIAKQKQSRKDRSYEVTIEGAKTTIRGVVADHLGIAMMVTSGPKKPAAAIRPLVGTVLHRDDLDAGTHEVFAPDTAPPESSTPDLFPLYDRTPVQAEGFDSSLPTPADPRSTTSEPSWEELDAAFAPFNDISDQPTGGLGTAETLPPPPAATPLDIGAAETLAPPAPAASPPAASPEAAPTRMAGVLALVPEEFSRLDRAHYPGEGPDEHVAFKNMIYEFIDMLEAIRTEADLEDDFDDSAKENLLNAVESWIGEGKIADDLKIRAAAVINGEPEAIKRFESAVETGRLYNDPKNINWNVFRQPLKSLDTLAEEELVTILQGIVPPEPTAQKGSPEALAQFKGMLTTFLSNFENFMSQYDMKNAKPELKKDIYLRLFRLISFRIGLPVLLRLYIVKRIIENADPIKLQAQFKIQKAIDKQQEAYRDFFDRSKLARPAAEIVHDTLLVLQRLDQEALRSLSNVTIPNPNHYKPESDDEDEQREAYVGFINTFLSILPVIQNEIPHPQDLETFNRIVLSRIARIDPLGQKLSDYTKQAYISQLNMAIARVPIDQMLSPDATPPYRLNWNIFGPTPPTGFTDEPAGVPPVDLGPSPGRTRAHTPTMRMLDMSSPTAPVAAVPPVKPLDPFATLGDPAYLDETEDPVRPTTLPIPPQAPAPIAALAPAEREKTAIEVKIALLLSAFGRQAKAAKAWNWLSGDPRPDRRAALNQLLTGVEDFIVSSGFSRERIIGALTPYIKPGSPLGPKLTATLQALQSNAPNYATLKTELLAQAETEQSKAGSHEVWNLFTINPSTPPPAAVSPESAAESTATQSLEKLKTAIVANFRTRLDVAKSSTNPKDSGRLCALAIGHIFATIEAHLPRIQNEGATTTAAIAAITGLINRQSPLGSGLIETLQMQTNPEHLIGGRVRVAGLGKSRYEKAKADLVAYARKNPDWNIFSSAPAAPPAPSHSPAEAAPTPSVTKYDKFIDKLRLPDTDKAKLKEMMSPANYANAVTTAQELKASKIPTYQQIMKTLMALSPEKLKDICEMMEQPKLLIVADQSFDATVAAMNENKHYTSRFGNAQDDAYLYRGSNSPYNNLPKPNKVVVSIVDGKVHPKQLDGVSMELGERRDHLTAKYRAKDMRHINEREMATLIQQSLREARAANDNSLIVDNRGDGDAAITFLDPESLAHSEPVVAYAFFASSDRQAFFGAVDSSYGRGDARGRATMQILEM